MNGINGKKLRGLLFAVMLLAGGWNLTAQEARIVELTGSVEIRDAGATAWRPTSVGAVIRRDTSVSTGVRSSAVISFGASTLTVSPLTMLTLEELTQRDGAEETALFLRSGRVRADVTPPGGLRAEFTVRSPSTTASVRGTSFDFDGNRVRVSSGEVVLSGNSSGQRVFVGENQRSQIDTERQGRLVPPLEAELAVLRPVLSGAEETGSERERPRPSGEGSLILIPEW